MWQPSLGETSQPLFQALLGVLGDDIQAGRLKPGDRLPPQRELAHRLGLGVGTVTRAYAEAERRGLIQGEVGRGSFVAGRPEAGAGPIDLARNLPPLAAARRALPAALDRLARRRDLGDQLGYAPGAGDEAARRALTAWIRRTAQWADFDGRRLVICAGAQQGTALALAATCRPGDLVLAESATFHGIKAICAQAGYRLLAGAMDGEGLTPEALDAAAAQGARAVYLLPVQNPTARVMATARRIELLAIARRRGLAVIEDDLYAPFAALLGRPPLAALAPDLVWYVTSLSKTLAPGLRTGCVVAPDDAGQARVLEALRAIAFGPPVFGPLVAADWIDSGEADAILEATLAELTARADLVRARLGLAVEASPMAAPPHLWLPMNELDAERVAGRALRLGVEVTPPRAFFQDGCPPTGLRLCLGAEPDRDRFQAGLDRLAQALGPDEHRAVV
ncbi:DNA-binding transcriptional MocR family regulator [Caulobacter ginsengisoli]|uniref:DNA-binding transcriptional MocR family regulator n=1 Tax=Caulobacter ginsengisoli TaxID=400775 RepID=A0ABU0ISY8_9CAUL|nr:PLP-dependent aminotransferase family protein [Caulobacter ginsengisoli]MDQ0465095.1 DNA-binding transcriptional MocR family regulator [Caulobacter ginsengisoli]